MARSWVINETSAADLRALRAALRDGVLPDESTTARLMEAGAMECSIAYDPESAGEKQRACYAVTEWGAQLCAWEAP